MPIKGLTEQRRLPRLGKIRLGEKKMSSRTQREYPVATTYFVCPPEVRAVYGDKPTRLDIIIPVEDDELWCPQYLKQYSLTRGLVCRGDGMTCRRMVDAVTGAAPDRQTETVQWIEGGECKGRDCADYQAKRCQEVMNLQVMLPKVKGLGVWQIDTGSINSIRNINDGATMIRAACGRVSWIPIVLSLEPTEVVNPEDGKKKTVYCMHLREEHGLAELMEAASRPKHQIFISGPAEDEAPADKLLNAGSPENAEELSAKVSDDIDDLWSDGTPAKPVQASGSPDPPHQAQSTPKPTKVEAKPSDLSQAEKEFDAIPSASQQKLATPKKLPPVTNEETEAFIAWLKANNLTGQMIKGKMGMTWMECLADIPAAKTKIKVAFALE